MHTTGGIRTGTATASGVTTAGGAWAGACAGGGETAGRATVVVVVDWAVVDAMLVVFVVAIDSSEELQAAAIPTSPTAAAVPMVLTTRCRVQSEAELGLWLNFDILDAFLMSARYRSGSDAG